MLKPEFGNIDNKPFDLLIIGQGIQALLVLNQAVDKGLNAILVSKFDCALCPHENPIQSMEFDDSFHLFKSLKHKYLIKAIRKSFLHLFISTKTEYYQPLNIFSKLQILFSKLIFKEITDYGKFKFSKFPYYSANAFKFSMGRMSASLLKKAIQLGAQVYSYSPIRSIQQIDSQLYNVEFKDSAQHKAKSISCKHILSFDFETPPMERNSDKIATNTYPVFYFTYPASNLKIDTNRFLKTSNQYLKIITWFDEVYFEFYDSKKTNISIDEILEFIQSHFTDIEIDRSIIQNSGGLNVLSKKQNKNQIQAIYFNDKKQIELKYKPINQWFDYSNKFCNQIVKDCGKVVKENSVIGRIVFPGSDLPVSNNPLRIMELADEKYDQAKQILKSSVYFKKLFYRYGSDIEQITEKAYESWNKTKDSQNSWLKAEIEYTIEYEFCRNALDFVNSRTELWMEKQYSESNMIDQIFKELL